MKSTSVVRIGSRQSALAMAQTRQVIDSIDFDAGYEIVPIISTGDKVDGPLRDHGGKRLFTKELDIALLNCDIDLAVHSMKDVETPLPVGLEIAAIPSREEPYDVLIYQNDLDLKNLPHGTKIGTSSLRRACQLKNYFNNIEIVPCRGNIQTRLKKFESGEMQAIVLAVAGLKRMGLFENGLIKDISAKVMVLDHEKYVPAAGQGALVVVKRAGDDRFSAMLAKVNHNQSRFCIEIEREVVKGLNATCHSSLGVHAKMNGDVVSVRVMHFVDESIPLIAEVTAPRDEIKTHLIGLIKDLKLKHKKDA